MTHACFTITGEVLMVLPDAATALRPGMRVVLNPKRCEILIIE